MSSPYILRFLRRANLGPSVVGAGGPDVALDVAAGGLTHSGATNSQTITVAPNVNKALIALIANDNTLTVSGVIYTAGSGGAWAKLNSFSTGNHEIEIWSSVAPSNGSVTVQATYSGTITQDANLVLYSLFNVDQTTPLDGYVSGANVVTLTTTLSSGGLILAHVGANTNPGVIITGTEDYNDAFNEFWKTGHNAASGTVAWTTSGTGAMNVCNVRAA